jgi:hypothetical protein
MFVADLGYAARSVMRARGFALAVVVTLGLGIGATTAIFSLVRGVLPKPLPHREGDRLMYLRQSTRGPGGENMAISVPEIMDFRAGSRALGGIAEYSPLTLTLVGDNDAVRIDVGLVTGNYFSVMGLSPVIGRSFNAGDDGTSAAPTGGQRASIAPLSTAVPVRGNLVLARSSTSSGLGRDALQEGKSYLIDIQTQGIDVTGTVRMPDRPQPTRILRGGLEVVVWPRAPGADGYVIRVDTDIGPAIALRDTEYVLKRDRPSNELPANPGFSVTALDSNLARFLTTPNACSAGIVGGHGLFGAMSTQHLALPTSR